MHLISRSLSSDLDKAVLSAKAVCPRKMRDGPAKGKQYFANIFT